MALPLAGCSSALSYIIDEYRGVPVVEVSMPDDTYRVFDKPAQSKMMITSSLASAAGQGFALGLTMGAADGPPKPRFEATAAKHLQDTGRTGCRLIDAYLLAKPQWEVKYDCTPLAAALPAVAQRPAVSPAARTQRRSPPAT
jgi:hypothetical protein